MIARQIKMVYGSAEAHAVVLDHGHSTELIAATEIGLTSQSLEKVGGKLLRERFCRTAGKIGGTATGMAFLFAATYAPGQVAKRYCARGRTMRTDLLHDIVQSLLDPGKRMQTLPGAGADRGERSGVRGAQHPGRLGRHNGAVHRVMDEVAKGILHLAMQLHCRGIVIGNRGLGLTERLLFGSVTSKRMHFGGPPLRWRDERRRPQVARGAG